MLNVESRFMIRDYHRKGLSISQIARLTGHDRKTIRQVLAQPLTHAPSPRQPKTRKIDPHVAYLQQRIGEGVLNAQKLYTEIATRGYSGGERAVRAFVHPFRQARQPQATVRFETEPGQQAQVDWAHFGFIQHQSRRRHLYAFVMTLGWSRAMYVEFTVSMEAAIFLRCHVRAFDYFGGVPRELLHDNLKTAVIKREGTTVHFHPRYLDFADYYGFAPRACQPYRAQTKGKVENGVKYVRGNFWSGLSYTDLGDLNRQGRDWLDTVANIRLHGTTHEVPFTRLAQEGLQSIALKPAYDTSLLTARRSSRDCLVSYGGNYYSVPARYASQPLTLKHTEADDLLILNAADQEVARHHLAAGRHQRIIQPSHYQGLKASVRPTKRATASQVLVEPPSLGVVLAAPTVEARPLSVYDALVEVAS